MVGTQLRRGDWRPRTHPRSAERRTVGRGKLPCSTAQYSTVQCSTGMRTRYNAGLAGNDWWPALTPAWFKLKTADWGSDNQCYLQLIPRLLASDTNMTQPAPHTFHLHLFASCATSYMHTTEITYYWVFLRKDKHPAIKRTTHNLYLLFIFWFFLQLASSPRRVAPALRRLARGSRLGPALGILETESWFNDEMNEHTITPSNKHANYCWSTTNGLIFLVTVGV